MFDKILIANRGEVACRIVRTCRRLGIATVAVYSEADATALHVAMADEAVPIGPPPPGESYLKIERIVEALRATGAEALHPGFGFLSENPAFVEAVEEAGAVFIGPPAAAIAAMGDKIASKALARRAGVPVIPGAEAAIEDADEAVRSARDIGYPAMIKAAAGGGGKGMRVVRSDRECREGFRAAAAEAGSAFGDARVFVEKYVEGPRHIEIQILADRHGSTIHLGERECSIQRRHQKIVEEAPSPLLDEATRRAMGERAVALARAVDYRSAGTVEFVSDRARRFYFLEMNTRLQVEHPVTERVTGLDIVEQMIRVAAGEKLAIAQEEVRMEGWAIEARLYAEDPRRGFLPSVGRLVRYRPPREGPDLRVDSGVREGSEVSIHYDPMLAKLIVHGRDRAAAVRAMRDALDRFQVRGVSHNIDLLGAIMREPRFADGALSTAFIDEVWPRGFSGGALAGEVRRNLIATAVFAHATARARDRASLGPPAASPDAPQRFVVRLGDESVPVTARPTERGLELEIEGVPVTVAGPWRPGAPLFEGRVDGDEIAVQIERLGTYWRLCHGGVSIEAAVLGERAGSLLERMPVKRADRGSGRLLSPMPGMVVDVMVRRGDRVDAGQAVAVIDAMKMENVLRADSGGTIAAVRVAKGDSVAVDQVLLEFEGEA